MFFMKFFLKSKLTTYLMACAVASSASAVDRDLELKKVKEQAKEKLSQNIGEFNSYRRPRSDGFINKDNVGEFLHKNIPLFVSSEDKYTKVYNYRWWMMMKHLREHQDKETKEKYYVFTEFFGHKGWASRSWAITCPAGHQFYDLRWMRDPKYLKSYAEYYMGGPASKLNQRVNGNFLTWKDRPESHHYSSWMIDGTEALLKVHPNKEWRDMMLPRMEHHQKVWDDLFTVKNPKSKTHGMYKILDLYDGMEFAISAVMSLIESDGAFEEIKENNWKKYYLGWGACRNFAKSEGAKKYPKASRGGYPNLYLVRPSVNSYFYGNNLSLANLYAQKAKESSDKEALKLSKKYKNSAAKIQQKTMSTLWNEEDQFFNTISAGDNEYGVKDYEARVRESVGFTPWYFNMVPKSERKFDKAWEMLDSNKGFKNAKGATTAERQSPYYNEHAYAWNGRGWPLSNSILYKSFANYLKNYKTEVTAADKKLLYKNIEQITDLHGKQPNIGEWYIPSNGRGFGGCKDYFHSSYPDMIIEDLLGFTSSHENKFSINTLLPQEKWDYFYLGNLRYHNRDIDIIWKKDWDAEKGGNQSKLCVWVDGKLKATSKSLNEKLTVKLD